MAFLNQAFALSQTPTIRPSEAKGFSRRGAWLVFEGSEMLALFQFCLSKQDKQPMLLIECHRGEGKGPHIYEGTRIISLTPSEDQVTVSTNLGPLSLFPEKKEDPNGRTVTNIQTLPEYFPMQEYLAFRQRQLQQQTSLKPQLS